jgi:hypothetical protein
MPSQYPTLQELADILNARFRQCHPASDEPQPAQQHTEYNLARLIAPYEPAPAALAIPTYGGSRGNQATNPVSDQGASPSRSPANLRGIGKFLRDRCPLDR